MFSLQPAEGSMCLFTCIQAEKYYTLSNHNWWNYARWALHVRKPVHWICHFVLLLQTSRCAEEWHISHHPMNISGSIKTFYLCLITPPLDCLLLPRLPCCLHQNIRWLWQNCAFNESNQRATQSSMHLIITQMCLCWRRDFGVIFMPYVI